MKLLNLLLLLVLFFSACGKKIPFKEKEPLKDVALVYIYSSDDEDMSDDVGHAYNFNIRINNKPFNKVISNDEYIPLYIKPGMITISATKNAAIEHTLKLDLLASHTYYLKIATYGYADFGFKSMSINKGSKEITNTKLVDSFAVDEKSIITSIVEEDTTQERVKTSKTDEIRKAYKMKTDGLITEEEYQKLKKDILYK